MSEAYLPLSIPNLKGNELAYVTEAIQTEWVSSAGPFVDKFECAVADYVGARGAVSCQNGTAGLHIALKLIGTQADDLVIVPTLTFIAAVNPIRYLGADPIFMDCDDSLCIDAAKTEAFLTEACTYDGQRVIHTSSQRTVRAIVAVHVFGNMADMDALIPLATRFGLPLVEDATEALGSYYTAGVHAGKHAGTMGTIGVYSFNGNKIITTGGGGMIVSDDEALLVRAKHLTTQAKVDTVNFIHDDIGYNYRMTNIQAGIGLAQLEQLESFIQAKTNNYQHYCSLLAGSAIDVLPFRSSIRANHWFYSLLLPDKHCQKRARLMELLAQRGIQTRPVWELNHRQQPYRQALTYRVELAAYYHARIVNVPCSSQLSLADVQRVCDELLQIVIK